MAGYLIRRILLGLLTLLLITMVVFALVRFMPGSPLDTDPAMMNPDKMPSAEDLERIKKAYGLDKPVHEAYWDWLKDLAIGDLGISFNEKKPVADVIGSRVRATLLLTVPSLVIAYLLAIPIGLWSTIRSGKLDERIAGVSLYMLYAIPSFIAALFLQLLFAVKLSGTAWELPLMGMHHSDYDEMGTIAQAWDSLQHMLLPVICFTYVSLAYYSRFIKANMEEVIRQDYIRTARAKGLGQMRIILHHAFRNTLIPFVTLLGLSLPSLLGGAIILEQVFNWPGMGQLYFRSISTRDYPVIMGLTLSLSVLTLLGQLFADILYAFVDPRITYK
ncbi:ABC transporter permease [Pirellulaceae bacterium]|jgi:peptide/nickel transport system permease protein|nr:ABC transporter permease [Pirellulaceae bacterium]